MKPPRKKKAMSKKKKKTAPTDDDPRDVDVDLTLVKAEPEVKAQPEVKAEPEEPDKEVNKFSTFFNTNREAQSKFLLLTAIAYNPHETIGSILSSLADDKHMTAAFKAIKMSEITHKLKGPPKLKRPIREHREEGGPPKLCVPIMEFLIDTDSTHPDSSKSAKEIRDALEDNDYKDFKRAMIHLREEMEILAIGETRGTRYHLSCRMDGDDESEDDS